LPFCKQAVQYRLKSGAGQGIGKVVAGVVAFLCSSDSDYMTGQTLNVDGALEMN
jgi:NAD(P)-dependent dehydrogenase (short-subunit alcohol dehydrogenase family)